MSHRAVYMSDRLVSFKSSDRLFQIHGAEVSNVLTLKELRVRLTTSVPLSAESSCK